MGDDGDSDLLGVGFLEKPFKVVKADSGGIRFKIALETLRIRASFRLYLLQKECSHKPLYLISFDSSDGLSLFCDALTGNQKTFQVPQFYEGNTDFWLTWFNDVICLGIYNEPPLLVYPEVRENQDKEMIGFVKFETCCINGHTIEWIVQSTSGSNRQASVPKKISGGDLRWVRISNTDPLPIDALIGGFENEPIYIARAKHRGSLCPGKYVKSKQLAYVPWGHIEHEKNKFEVLCGHDAVWMKSKDRNIPENAFIAGYSEVRQQPLYIGRAWLNSNLLVGKVHLMYNTCYLPYNGREVEKTEYEILVVGNQVCYGESRNSLYCAT